MKLPVEGQTPEPKKGSKTTVVPVPTPTPSEKVESVTTGDFQPAPAIENITEPAVEAVAEPTVEPTVEAVVEPVEEVAEPVAENITEPAVEAVAEVVAEPVVASVVEPERADIDVVEQEEGSNPTGSIPSAKFIEGVDRRGKSDDATKPDLELPGSNPEEAQSHLRPYFGRPKRANDLGLMVTEADICFHLNKSWRGGVCTIMGNRACPFLGGQQQTCDKYSETRQG